MSAPALVPRGDPGDDGAWGCDVGEAGEVVLFAQDGLQLWRERRPGFTIFGSYVGRVLLTSSRLLFLSAGDSGATRRLLAGAALGPIGLLVFGETPTADLDERALEAEGSLAVPLGAITAHAAQRRCDCTNYVGVQYMQGDTVASCAFMPKDAVLWGGAARWDTELAAARAALSGAPYR